MRSLMAIKSALVAQLIPQLCFRNTARTPSMSKLEFVREYKQVVPNASDRDIEEAWTEEEARQEREREEEEALQNLVRQFNANASQLSHELRVKAFGLSDQDKVVLAHLTGEALKDAVLQKIQGNPFMPPPRPTCPLSWMLCPYFCGRRSKEGP